MTTPGLVASSWGQWRDTIWWIRDFVVAASADGEASFERVLRTVVGAVGFLGSPGRFEWRVQRGSLDRSVAILESAELKTGLDLVADAKMIGVSIDIDVAVHLPNGGSTVVPRGAWVGVEWKHPFPDLRPTGDEAARTINVGLNLRTAAHTSHIDGYRWMSDNREVAVLNTDRLRSFLQTISQIDGAEDLEVTYDTVQGPDGYVDDVEAFGRERSACLDAWHQLLDDPTRHPRPDPLLLEDLFMLGANRSELTSIVSHYPNSEELLAHACSVLDAINQPIVPADDAELRALASAHVTELNRIREQIEPSESSFTNPDNATPVAPRRPDNLPDHRDDLDLISQLAATTGQEPKTEAWRSVCRTKNSMLDAYLWGPLANPATDLSAYFQLWRRGADCVANRETIYIWRRQLLPFIPATSTGESQR